MKVLFSLFVIISTCFSFHGRFDTLWINGALKIRNIGEARSIAFIDSTDSLIDITEIIYGTDYRTTFPELIYFDTTNATDGIIKKGSSKALYASIAVFPDPDSGAYLLLTGVNNALTGNYILQAGYSGDGWLRAAFHYWTFGGDTAEAELVPLTSDGISFGCSQAGDTLELYGGDGTGTGIRMYDRKVHLIDTALIDIIKIGNNGAVIDSVQMVDDTNDTLKISIGGKTWCFLPDADQ